MSDGRSGLHKLSTNHHGPQDWQANPVAGSIPGGKLAKWQEASQDQTQD
jgi:hypothetical protein